MGMILSPYAVDIQKLSGLIGSKNKRIVTTLAKKFAEEIEEIDETVAEDADDEDDEMLTTRDALNQMVMGEEYNDDFGFVYGCALELLCRQFGEFLPNEEWSAMRSTWVAKADKALKSAGVGVKILQVERMISRGSPIPIPEIEDFPSIGFMRLSEITTALNEFGEDKLASVKDKEVRAALAEVRGWLESCVASKRDLVCFYA